MSANEPECSQAKNQIPREPSEIDVNITTPAKFMDDLSLLEADQNHISQQVDKLVISLEDESIPG